MVMTLNPQNSFAPTDARRAGAHGFQYDAWFDRTQKRVELLARPRQLDRIAFVRHVENAAAKNIGEPLHFVALLAGGADLDEHQLALDVVALRQVDDLDDFDELVQLLGNLLD